ncbi:MAG: phenylalanine--tRNA ligase subunit beta [Candidatus Binatia bacterium]
MRIPFEWLREFVVVDMAPEALADRLTLAGLVAEGLEPVGRIDPRVVAGRIVAVERHAAADRLEVCRVDVGTGAPIVVVSGAPDLRPGRCVPVARVGAVLPSGTEVRAAPLRGVASEGMLCSEVELALGDDGSGVLELPADAPPGRSVAELPGIADTVLVLDVTPNRADCLSMLGVAREVAALTGTRLRPPRLRVRESGAPATRDASVEIVARDLCAEYCARVIRDVRIGPSPLGVRLRLRRAGMRPINAVVDATNYVMLELGQPLHAFDLSRVAGGRIVVRRATAGETFTTLDGVARKLEVSDLVIADGRGPVALAGVMGGAESEVAAGTTSLLLESAFFAPSCVRRTARRLGLLSQAAYRFERRVDPGMVAPAADAGAALIVRLAGGAAAPGVARDTGSVAGIDPPAIRLRPSRAASLLGVAVPKAEVTRRLRALGAACSGEGPVLVVAPPSHRGDLRIEEDVVEEIARLGGYDAIPTTLPLVEMEGGADSEARGLARRLRGALVAEGLTEMVTLAFTDGATNALLPGHVLAGLAPVVLRNPLSAEFRELRRSALAGLVRALGLNVANGASFVGAFEIGRGFGIDADGTRHERRMVSIVLHGVWPPTGAERSGPAVEFLDLKGMVGNALGGLGADVERLRWRARSDVGFVHPGKTATIVDRERVLGIVGALHPRVAQALDLAGEVFVCELDFDAVGHYGPRRVGLRPVPRFPAASRDIAVIVEEAFAAESILEEIRALGDPLIESAHCFDCYRGAPVPSGKKSLAYSIAYRHPDRTLTDDEVNAAHGRVRRQLAARFALELRS